MIKPTVLLHNPGLDLPLNDGSLPFYLRTLSFCPEKAEDWTQGGKDLLKTPEPTVPPTTGVLEYWKEMVSWRPVCKRLRLRRARVRTKV